MSSREYVDGDGSRLTGGLAPATLKFTAATSNEATADAKSGLSNEPESKFPTAVLNVITAVSNVVIAALLPSYGETELYGDT